MANLVSLQSVASHRFNYHALHFYQCFAAVASTTKPAQHLVARISTHLQLRFVSDTIAIDLAALATQKQNCLLSSQILRKPLSADMMHHQMFTEIADVKAKWRPGL